ncbi:MAG: RHS repeat-associated core domain-containing protein, partial [Planctomycetota bacterium]
GTWRKISDSGESVAQTFESDGFGIELARTGAVLEYLFSGKERDADTGLDHFFWRSYASALGRFVQTDPIFALNLYVYVSNNPMLFVDPLGLQGISPEEDIAPPANTIKGSKMHKEHARKMGGGVKPNMIWVESIEELQQKAQERSRLSAIKAKARDLSNLVSQCKISDCEALALMAEFVAKYHTNKGIFGTDDETSFINDMTKVLSGISGRFGTADEEYYVGYDAFHDSCFKDKYRDGSNQVRHFTGYILLGWYYGRITGTLFNWRRELALSGPDVALGNKGITLGIRLAWGLLGLDIDDVGNWIREELCKKDKNNCACEKFGKNVPKLEQMSGVGESGSRGTPVGRPTDRPGFPTGPLGPPIQ